MKKISHFAVFHLLPVLLLLCLVDTACAQNLETVGILDDVLSQFQNDSKNWLGRMHSAALWLFLCLIVISMTWTFGMMALRKADIAEFFAEFVRFTMFFGFFLWLLENGPTFAMSIVDSLRKLAGEAGGKGLSPSGIMDIGFEIVQKTVKATSVWSPIKSVFAIFLAVIIVIILALVAVNMLLLLISAWVLAYAGIFFLGFGGSRWTSEIAINYYKTVLSIAAQLMTMALLIGICNDMLDKFSERMVSGNYIDLSVIVVMAVVTLLLVNKLPALIGGIVTGASMGGAGIGQFGAGTAMGVASMAMAAAATGGAAMAAGLKEAAGAGAAIHAAFSGAGSGSSTDSGGSGNKSSGEGSGGNSTPFAQAAGFSNNSSSGSSGSGKGDGKSEASGSAFSDSGSKGNSGNDKASPDGSGSGGSNASPGSSGAADGSGKGASNGNSKASAPGSTSTPSGSGNPGALKNLWEGTKDAIKSGFNASIADTAGGKIATAIKARTEARNAEAAEVASFDGNSLSSGSNNGSNADVAEEVSNFVNGKSFREVDDDDDKA